MPWLFDWHDFDNTAIEKAFDVALHLGTLVAVVGYFRRDLVVRARRDQAGRATATDRRTPEGRLAWLLVLSSIPAAIAGALFEKTIDKSLGNPVDCRSLIVFRRAPGLEAIAAPGSASCPTTSVATPSRSAWPRCWP